ncbi:hypothetical protein BDM02DRAFT_4807 [Thelephora ganbajun]|uniref:Uncharacterized protein n=1 Tax=Thelephora ganbajun TaxID=370292 RepID=A0ACB6ZXN6_THEGA|nr:hypothetical protein BDM02DRAFT_4807 [Thelephora ganbajun]
MYISDTCKKAGEERPKRDPAHSVFPVHLSSAQTPSCKRRAGVRKFKVMTRVCTTSRSLKFTPYQFRSHQTHGFPPLFSISKKARLEVPINPCGWMAPGRSCVFMVLPAADSKTRCHIDVRVSSSNTTDNNAEPVVVVVTTPKQIEKIRLVGYFISISRCMHAHAGL